MKKIAAMILGMCVLGGVAIGCDKKEAEDVHTVKNPDGSSAKDSTVVKHDSDGTVTSTHEQKVTPATNHN